MSASKAPRVGCADADTGLEKCACSDAPVDSATASKRELRQARLVPPLTARKKPRTGAGLGGGANRRPANQGGSFQRAGCV